MPAAEVPARARLDTMADAVAVAGFAAAGPLALLAPKGLWIAGVVIALARCLQLAGAGRGRTAHAVLADLARLRLLWLLAALALASTLWAVLPEHSLQRGLRLVLELAVGALVVGCALAADRRQARTCMRAAAAGLSAAAVIATADILRDGQLMFWAHGHIQVVFAYGRGAAFAAVAAVPLLALLWLNGSRAWALVLAVAAVVFVLTAANDTAKLVLLATLVGAAAALWRWTRPLPILAFAVALIAVPLVLPVPLDGWVGCSLMDEKRSILHRLGIWNFVDAAIGERPLLGWGLEASRKIPGGTMILATPDCGPEANPATHGLYLQERLPLHPHDFALNLWLELGAAGAFLLLCTLLDWAWRLARLSRGPAIAICAAATGAFLPATLSFGMWQGWWLTTLFLVVALCLLAPRGEAAKAGTPRHGRAQRRSSDAPFRAGRARNLAL